MTSRLVIDSLSSGYGKVRVVRDISADLDAGEVLAILGPNGAGKTTTLLTIAGMLARHTGTVSIDGQEMASGDAVEANRNGVVLVPDDRALFQPLSVEEHLQLACQKAKRNPRELLDVFPALEKRWDVAAGNLSGGEQQMLAVARGLAQDPRVLLIDEMSMGLAPIIVEDLLPVVRRAAADHGAAVVLVEQHVSLALEVADKALVMAHGEVVLASTAEELRNDDSALDAAYLG